MRQLNYNTQTPSPNASYRGQGTHSVGNSAKDIRLSQDLQSSHYEHGPEVDPEGHRGEKNMEFSHRCEHQEALAPDPVPDSIPGDPGNFFFRTGTGLSVRDEMEQSFIFGLCKQPAHCHDGRMQAGSPGHLLLVRLGMKSRAGPVPRPSARCSHGFPRSQGNSLSSWVQFREIS